jgi:hypothetical protein
MGPLGNSGVVAEAYKTVTANIVIQVPKPPRARRTVPADARRIVGGTALGARPGFGLRSWRGATKPLAPPSDDASG